MKRNLLIFGLVVFATAPLYAQQGDTVFQKREVIIIDDEPDETVVQQSREVIVRDIEKNESRYKRDKLEGLGSMGLGYSGLIQNLSNLELPEGAEWMDLKSKSINFNLQLVDYHYNMSKHFGFRTGLELEVNNYRFSRNITPALDASGNNVIGQPIDYPLKKTKLVTCFLNVPLVASVSIGHKSRVKAYGGIVGGWRWNSYTKLRSSQFGKDHNRTELNLRNFHYGYTAGIAYRGMGLYATYYPHSIFSNGPDVRSANIGLLLFY